MNDSEETSANAGANAGASTLEAPDTFDWPLPKDVPVSTFREIWAYVIDGQEAALKSGLPVTDIGYFAADVNILGELTGVP